MQKLLLRRLLQMLLIMLSVSALLFAIFDSEQFRKKVAVAELGGFGIATLSDTTITRGSSRKG